MRPSWFSLIYLPLLSFILLFAQPPSEVSAQARGGLPTVADSLEGGRDRLEIEILRAQLVAMQGYQDDLLATVYWSLGALGGVLLGILGFSWFANFRIYDRDKVALTQELKGLVAQDLAMAKTELYAAVEEWRTSTEVLARRVASEALSEVQLEFRTLGHRLVDVELELAMLHGDFRLEMKHFGNAFTYYIRAASLGRRNAREWVVKDALGRIEKALERMDGVFGSDLQKLGEFLKSVEGQDDVEVERIRQRLNTVQRLA